MKCWSKRYDDANNPEEDFLAIMVCDDADANCPVIPTARKRIALRYIDPKFSDGTSKEMVTYKRTTREIGSEVFSLF
ncbi:MAG: arsenate reductase [Neolewinella sp.]